MTPNLRRRVVIKSSKRDGKRLHLKGEKRKKVLIPGRKTNSSQMPENGPFTQDGGKKYNIYS